MKQIQVRFLFLKQICFYCLRRCTFLLSAHSYFSTDGKKTKLKRTAKSQIPRQHFLNKPGNYKSGWTIHGTILTYCGKTQVMQCLNQFCDHKLLCYSPPSWLTSKEKFRVLSPRLRTGTGNLRKYISKTLWLDPSNASNHGIWNNWVVSTSSHSEKSHPVTERQSRLPPCLWTQSRKPYTPYSCSCALGGFQPLSFQPARKLFV